MKEQKKVVVQSLIKQYQHNHFFSRSVIPFTFVGVEINMVSTAFLIYAYLFADRHPKKYSLGVLVFILNLKPSKQYLQTEDFKPEKLFHYLLL